MWFGFYIECQCGRSLWMCIIHGHNANKCTSVSISFSIVLGNTKCTWEHEGPLVRCSTLRGYGKAHLGFLQCILLSTMVPASKHPEAPVDYSQHASHALRFQSTYCIGATPNSFASSRYCLAGRPKCRFGFPSPMGRQQQYGNDTESLTWRRMYHSEDPWLLDQAPEKATCTPGQFNIARSDSKVNSDNATCYVNKYVSKIISYNAAIRFQDGGTDWTEKACCVVGLLCYRRIVTMNNDLNMCLCAVFVVILALWICSVCIAETQNDKATERKTQSKITSGSDCVWNIYE